MYLPRNFEQPKADQDYLIQVIVADGPNQRSTSKISIVEMGTGKEAGRMEIGAGEAVDLARIIVDKAWLYYMATIQISSTIAGADLIRELSRMGYPNVIVEDAVRGYKDVRAVL